MVYSCKRIALLLFTLSLFIVNTYSVLLYMPDSNSPTSYFYFVNSTNLEINVTLQSLSKPLVFSQARLEDNQGNSYVKDYDIDLNPEEEISLFLDITEFEFNGSFYSTAIFEDEEYTFLELKFEELSGTRYYDEQLPSEVMILNYDPNLTLKDSIFVKYLDSQEDVILRSDFVNIDQELISSRGNIGKSMISYIIYDSEGNVLMNSEQKDIYTFSDLKQSITLDFLNGYSSGSYDFVIELVNIAGTRFTEEFRVIIEEEYLDLSLLTLRDDASLQYYYSSNKELYGNVIYTGAKNFEFKIQTNKESQCFFNSKSVSQSYSDNSLLFSEEQSIPMTSNEQFIHSVSISPFLFNDTTKYFWVGCTDKSGLEKVTLHSALGSSLLNFNQNLQFSYHSEELLLDLIYPTTSLLTSNKFTTRLLTSTKAQCTLNVGSSTLQLKQENYLDHQVSLELENGNHNLEYLCKDVLYKEQTLSKGVEMDTTRGVAISVDDIYYSGKNSYELSFTTSDVVESCKYTKQPESIDNYDTFTHIGSDTNSFTTILGPLLPGENRFYLHCKSGLTSTVETIILFDQSGPQISNMSFLFEGITTTSYVPQEGNVELEFSVLTTIPVEKYEILLTSANTSETLSISGSSKTGSYDEEINLNEDLGTYTKLSITPINEIGKRGNTIEKTIQFDLTPPEVTLIKNGNSWNVICIDPETQCNDIWYGFSNSLISCPPSYSYSDGNLLDASGYSAICARATNRVGLMSEVTTLATGEIVLDDQDGNDTGSQGSGSGGGSNPFDRGDQQENQSVEVPLNDSIIKEEQPEEFEEEQPKKPEQPLENYTSEEESNTTTIVILSALALVLLAAGGGGYYAYKKGYLNKQLQQLGIKIPNQGTQSSTSGKGYYDSSLRNSSKPLVPKLTQGNQKSNYDEHLSKLNSFLDDTLDKKKSVFDSFKTSQKGRVDTYQDTLAKENPSNPKKKEEFGDFYKASSSSSSQSSSQQPSSTSSEDEADKFEEYYKKKKKESSQSKDSNSKKKKQ